jgi:hypothetical protein
MADEQPNQVRENEPPDLGYAPPDTGQGDDAESEIPRGVDALPDEAIAAAEERGGGGGEGDEGAIDVSAIVADEGGDEGTGAAADEGGEDATEKTDVEAQAAPDTGEDA